MPNNQVLSGHKRVDAEASLEPATPADTEYPRALFHKDSKPGALISKVVNSADEAAELGKEWGPLAALNFETAPAAKEAGDGD